jgi:predicted transcriptional regulator of viral defense system
MKITALTKIMHSLSREHGKKLFTLREMALLTGESRASVGMALLRAKREGIVASVKNVWINMMDRPSLEDLALAVKSLSYISFESALYWHGIISQSPRGALTLATIQRPERISTPLGDIAFVHIPKKLFFGFDESRLALPEKAYLDLLYMNVRKGRGDIQVVIYKEDLDQKVLVAMSKKFPAYVLNA